MNGTEITAIPERLIDIEALFASKNSALLKIIPRFVISYLKKITHQEAVNGYIYRNRDKSGLPFVNAILKEFGVGVDVVDGRGQATPVRSAGNHPDMYHEWLSEIIRPTGRYIVAANHPLGGLDGMALMHALGKVREDIVFPVNDLLLYVPGLRPLFIPINKHGRNSENARLIDETFASDKTVLYFPAGLCSRKQKGQVICDLEWKTTFIKKARKYHRDIVPVYVAGRNSDWFYNLSRWRKRLGIKANIEMLYLVDEMVKQLGNTITFVVGDPLPWSSFDRSKTDIEWAAMVKESVYELGRRFNSAS